MPKLRDSQNQLLGLSADSEMHAMFAINASLRQLSKADAIRLLAWASDKTNQRPDGDPAHVVELPPVQERKPRTPKTNAGNGQPPPQAGTANSPSGVAGPGSSVGNAETARDRVLALSDAVTGSGEAGLSAAPVASSAVATEAVPVPIPAAAPGKKKGSAS